MYLEENSRPKPNRANNGIKQRAIVMTPRHTARPQLQQKRTTPDPTGNDRNRHPSRGNNTPANLLPLRQEAVKGHMREQTDRWIQKAGQAANALLIDPRRCDPSRAANWFEWLVNQTSFFTSMIPHPVWSTIIGSVTRVLNNVLDNLAGVEVRSEQERWYAYTFAGINRAADVFNREMEAYVNAGFARGGRLGELDLEAAINDCMRRFWRHDLQEGSGARYLGHEKLQDFARRRLDNALRDWQHACPFHARTLRRVDEAIRRLLRNMGARGQQVSYPPPTTYAVTNRSGATVEFATLRDAYEFARGGSNNSCEFTFRLAYVGWPPSYGFSGILVVYSGSPDSPGQTFELVAGIDRRRSDFHRMLRDAVSGERHRARRISRGKPEGPDKAGSGDEGELTKQIYVVKPGDSLWTIAKQRYGNGRLWNKIYTANRSAIKNPNVIHPGQKLVIP